MSLKESPLSAVAVLRGFLKAAERWIQPKALHR